MRKGLLEPFYFGAPAKQLFGCYHAPQSVRRQDCGVVLCYPMGHEYTDFHRAYRQLAVHLSRAGFSVLRFDFYGCGDSSGACEEGQIQQWLSDIATALAEIRARCGLVKYWLLGVRLGGTLAAMSGAQRGDVEGMVLWNPVISGRAYIRELTVLHHTLVQDPQGKPQHGIRDDMPSEVLGFPLTEAMLTVLEDIDLLSIQQKPAKHILVIENNDAPTAGRFIEHLQKTGAHVEHQHLSAPPIGVRRVDMPLVPHRLWQSVVSWISEVAL
jgi:pimeloyl-ACP methyl ester carboxylesterase